MGIIRKIIVFNISIILFMIVLLIFNSFDRGYGLNALAILSENILYIFISVICLANIAVMCLISLLITLLGSHTQLQMRYSMLNSMFRIKLAELLIYIVIVIVLYVHSYIVNGWNNIQWSFLVSDFEFTYRATRFYLICIGTSLLYIKPFFNGSKSKWETFILWLSTIFPVLDIIVLLLLMYRKDKQENTGDVRWCVEKQNRW